MPPIRPDPGRAMAGGRSFVDATGTPVPLRGPIRLVVATDGAVGMVLLALGARLAGCAGALDGIPAVGTERAPDHAAIAAVRPDVIVTGTVDGVHDLVEPAQVLALSRIAPVIAVDLGRAAAAIADLRALLGPVRPPRPPTARA